MSKYEVVMNLYPVQTDILLETDDLEEAKSFAKSFNDKDVEIWSWINESSYDKIEY
jgi:hypothetical protein